MKKKLLILKKVIKKVNSFFNYLVWNRIIKIYINILYPIKFSIRKSQFMKKEDNNNKIIVSLTSIPSRIDKIHYVIKSLLLQSLRPEKIILWLSEDDFKDRNNLPKSLNELLNTNVEVKWCENIKPHKKYLYTMIENPDAVVITVDDDVFYRKNLIRDLVEAHKKYPDAIICTRAHKMKFNKDRQLLSYNEWDYEVKGDSKPSKLLFATGVGGVLYPPNSLDKRAFDVKLIYKLCLNADDVWLKAMQILNDRLVLAIPASKSKYVVGIINAEKIRLSQNNVLNSENDKYIKGVFEKFNITYFNFMED